MIGRLKAAFNRLTDRETEVQSLDDIGNRSVTPQIRPATVMKVVMAVVVIAAGSIALIGPQPVLAASITSSDLKVTTSDGNITSVSIAPEYTIAWENLDSGVDQIDIRTKVSNDSSNWETIVALQAGCSVDRDFCGNKTGSYGSSTSTGLNITDSSEYRTGSSPPFDLDDFNASDGESQVTTVYVKVEVWLTDADNNRIKSTSDETSFVVNVTNIAGTVSTSHSLDTNLTTPSG